MPEISVVSSGIGIGGALAIVLSYLKHKHIGYAIVHGAIGWVYVIYYGFKYNKWHKKL